MNGSSPEPSASFRALVNPCANESDLFRRERLWRRTESAGTARSAAGTTAFARGPIGLSTPRPAWRTISRTAPSTWPAGSARFRLGRHRRFIVDPRCRDNQQTFLAGAGNDDFAVLAAFEHRFEAVEAQFAFLLFFAVAPETGGFEKRSDVFGVSEAFLVRRRWEFADVDFAEVDLIVGGHDRPSGGHKAQNEQS